MGPHPTFGSWKTVWARHRRWAADGTWDRVLGVLPARADDDGLIGWRVAGGGWRLAAGGWRLAAGGWRLAVNSTITRAHQHATNTADPRNAGPQPEGRTSTPTENPPGTRSAVPAAG
ncbi:hypothetical protein ACIOZL_36780 [Streptomyces sp. NPDC087769]|uniref:hypothetical protein n=1 Tax=Streptomyces sp. NPDC087769 TaxID=3365802 RepID=UPI00381444AB